MQEIETDRSNTPATNNSTVILPSFPNISNKYVKVSKLNSIKCFSLISLTWEYYCRRVIKKKGDSQWQKRSICYCPLGKTNLPSICLFWWGPQCCLLHQWSHITKWTTRKYTSGHKVTLQSFCTCEIPGPQRFTVRWKLEGFIGYLIQILCHSLFIRNKVIYFSDYLSVLHLIYRMEAWQLSLKPLHKPWYFIHFAFVEINILC